MPHIHARRPQIAAMVGHCIKLVSLGEDLSIAKIDELGYANILVEIAMHEGLRITGSIGSPSSVLEAAEELGIISDPTQIEFLKRHELLVHIDSALMALAHHDRKAFGRIRETWLGKSFAEKEKMLEQMPQAPGLRAELVKLRGKSAEVASRAVFEKDPAAKARLNKELGRLTAKINLLHGKFSQMFNEHYAKSARKMDMPVDIRKLRVAAHSGGRDGRVLRKYAEALQEIASGKPKQARAAAQRWPPFPKPSPSRLRLRGK